MQSTIKGKVELDKLGALRGMDIETDEFLNRDLGWLEFNARVLALSQNCDLPLLERLRFLIIFSTNLDEFYMKRIGEVSSAELLQKVRERIADLQSQQASVQFQLKTRDLPAQGIYPLSWKQLTKEELEIANLYFRSHLFPVLTPLAVDHGHPFPFISNLSSSFGIRLKSPSKRKSVFARLKIPKVFTQWVELANQRFVHIEDIIFHNLGHLFPGMIVESVMVFRVTRNAEAEAEEDIEADDLLEMVEEELRLRRFAEVVRLEYRASQEDKWILNLLMDELSLQEKDCLAVEGDLDLTDYQTFLQLDRPELKFPVWIPSEKWNGALDQISIFDRIRQRDRLLHHPFDSFSSTVEAFIDEAALDPKVVALKMTLYRTGDDSAIIKSLIKAAEAGKQVVCLIELKARFDEARNIYWAQKLEDAGIHVVYGVVGLKTHCKLALVVRNEGQNLVSYLHIGTGNYNSQTAKSYTDLGLLTADSRLTSEVVELFHFLTGRSQKDDYQHLLVSPTTLRSGFCSLIERELEHAQAGRPAQIICKFNNMDDEDMSRRLTKAAVAGCQIDLVIRGFSILRPRANIRISSLIGRFLEHSRIYYFRNGQTDPILGDFFIGSADLMHRNLSKRVETVAPIYCPELKLQLWHILVTYLDDQVATWDLDTCGSYKLRRPHSEGALDCDLDSQQKFMFELKK